MDKTSVIKGPHDVVCKTRAVTFADTTARVIATLPKGARIMYIMINGIASNAATTGTLSFGTTVTSNEYVSAYDVKTAANGVGPSFLPGISGVYGAVLQNDTPIWVKYAETGTGATAGSWKVSIVYTVGNFLNDDTI